MNTINTINIASFHHPVTCLGPGNRFVLWVQGCPFDCKGCTSPDYIPFKENKRVEIEKLAEMIISIEGIDGITLSGGEPFAQPKELAKLLDLIIDKRPELNILCFTGYSLEQLKSSGQKTLLTKIDLLITELFVEELNSEIGLRGSDNQQFIYLTDKLKPFKLEIEESKKKTQTFIEDGKITQVGIMSESENIFYKNILDIIESIN
jgi:anaerobic ribonucleoside-triphosphate reductase activating protein